MRKYDLISALSAETSKEVARNEESWKMCILVREYRCSGGTETASPAEGNR